MNKIISVAKKAKMSSRLLYYIINAERRPTNRAAFRLEKITGIKKEVWVFGDKVDRKAAWKEFLNETGTD